MITIVNTGAAPVRVAGRYLQPGEQCLVAEETAAQITRHNPAVVVVTDEAAAGESVTTDEAAADAEPPGKPAAAKAAPKSRRRS